MAARRLRAPFHASRKKEKMKWIVLILGIANIYSFNSEIQSSDYLKKIDINDTLRIEYIAGDESTEFNEVEIMKRGQRLFVKRNGRTLYVGNQAEGDWLKPLSKKNKELINDFIFNSTKQKNKDYWSSWREEYLITFSRDTISNLVGNFEWGVQKYYSFEEELFKEEFEELRKKRNSLDKEIRKNLKGEWGVIGNLSNLERGEKIKLYRINKRGEKCSWSFTDKKNFKSNCSEIDLEFSNEYRLDIDEGLIFLDIEVGWQRRIGKSSELKNYGASFKIYELKKDSVKLEFMWR